MTVGKGTHSNKAPHTWEAMGFTWIKHPERERREDSRESNTQKVRGKGTHVNQALTSRSLSNLPALSGVKNGSFPLKIWSWPWHDLDLWPQGHSKVILNVKFCALLESGVKSRGSYLKNKSWHSSHLQNRGQDQIQGHCFWLFLKQLLSKIFISILLSQQDN